ncbi:C45 family autoproteolytic acyltransferase/hydolase [Roseovarius autotrophicus]|uniref:C45 family autoproteolytic acyltransferase/hydolase n=1 Tax=Roseovarius autotrophicus TaxID=2824121 RepID=UPI001B36F446|nr:C45 family peptidase [Roseovarius autotrophicus]
MTGTPELRRITARGTPRKVGRALGEAGRTAVHTVLLHTPYWQAVTAPAYHAAVARMGEELRARFPTIHEEVAGLAEGLALPFEDVIAWNCRGDLISNAPDGCTTVLMPGREPVIAHNEDGLPGFRGHAFLADVMPEGAPGFTAFCYPGSIPGHTFAVTGVGLVQAVNNIRLRGVVAAVPRMALGRAALGCRSLDEVTAHFRANHDSGGFHMGFAHAGDTRILSVEYGGGAVSVGEITEPKVHANHALHLPLGPEGQSITRSSADRQARGTALLAQGIRDPLAILRDTAGPGLPIFRTAPDDPDDENTLATTVFRMRATGVEWEVRAQNRAKVEHHGVTGI